MTRKLFVVASLVVLCHTTSAFAEVININIAKTGTGGGGTNPTNLDGTTHTPSVAPGLYSGSGWNDGGITQTDLTDSDGTPGIVDIAWSNLAGNANAFLWSNGAVGPAALNNYFAANDDFGGGGEVDASQITLSDLGANSVWDIYFLSQGDAAGQGGSFTINGNTLVSSGSDPAATAFIDGQNYVFFDNVNAGVAGEIIVGFDDADPLTTGGGGDYQTLNGVQLVRDGTVVLKSCDVNGINDCNSSDFEIIKNNLFQFEAGVNNASRGDGDLNDDQEVTYADFRIFKDHPDRVIGTDPLVGALTGVVPEPSSVLLLAISSLLAIGSPRRSVLR